MERFLIVFLFAGVACSGGGPQSSPPTEIEKTSAWVALTPQFRVILEPLPEMAESQRSFAPEEEMLQMALGLEDVPLVRLHLLGNAQQLEESGVIHSGGKLVAQTLGSLPSGLDLRAKNLWIGLGQGAAATPLLEGMQHRTFLLRLLQPIQDLPLSWQAGERSLPLQERHWTGAERRKHLTLSQNPETIHG